jgi:bifunctional non-homologous end joining protein LigD
VTTVTIEGREVRLTNLDKVLYPQAGFTKAHVIDYYRRIAPVLLPHLRGRALTLKRYPDGVEGEFFYEKEAPSHRPRFVRTEPVWSEGRGADIHYVVCDDLPTLVWLANIGDLELHAFLARARKPLAPTAMVFDLDPGAPANVLDCCEVALWLRDLFDELGLRVFPKTSGSKGIQLYVPLHVPATFEDTKPFARAMGEIVERDHPDRVTTNMSKAERPGKVFVDWSQNDDHKTTVCAYSLRAKERPTVSTPLSWDEVEKAASDRDAERLRFLPEDVLARVDQRGDLFAPVLTLEQGLPALGPASRRLP